MTNAATKPVSATSLDVLEDLIARAKRQGATAADAVMFDSTDISTSIRKGKPESMERAESTGIGLRVFVGQRIATVSSSDFKNKTLDELAERAVSMAKIAPEDPYAALATPDQFATDFPIWIYTTRPSPAPTGSRTPPPPRKRPPSRWKASPIPKARMPPIAKAASRW